VLVLAALLLSAPAHAVVGGKRVSSRTVPWFVNLSGCGGTLVAPDRVVTAGHCVRGASLEDLSPIGVGGTRRRAVHFALAPGWQRENGGNLLDDIALIQLDVPVEGVTPAALPAASTPRRAIVLGRGASTSSGGRAGTLREATLKVMSDRACARDYRTRRGNDEERFNAPRMVCATDVDGRAPLSSACYGDSGGPLYAGTKHAPVLLGIVSFGGDRCGADRLPSVFTEVTRYREFITAPAPVWAPRATGPVAITGEARVGGELTCAAPWETPPDTIQVQWLRLGAMPKAVSDEATYRPGPADQGRTFACNVTAFSAGGFARAQPATIRVQ
jgi:secreted trypsin-like serine protease